jgi:hypothetical protein
MEWGRGKELGETGRGEVTNWVELPPPEAVSAVAVPREEKDADGWLVVNWCWHRPPRTYPDGTRGQRVVACEAQSPANGEFYSTGTTRWLCQQWVPKSASKGQQDTSLLWHHQLLLVLGRAEWNPMEDSPSSLGWAATAVFFWDAPRARKTLTWCVTPKEAAAAGRWKKKWTPSPVNQRRLRRAQPTLLNQNGPQKK